MHIYAQHTSKPMPADQCPTAKKKTFCALDSLPGLLHRLIISLPAVANLSRLGGGVGSAAICRSFSDWASFFCKAAISLKYFFLSLRRQPLALLGAWKTLVSHLCLPSHQSMLQGLLSMKTHWKLLYGPARPYRALQSLVEPTEPYRAYTSPYNAYEALCVF